MVNMLFIWRVSKVCDEVFVSKKTLAILCTGHRSDPALSSGGSVYARRRDVATKYAL